MLVTCNPLASGYSCHGIFVAHTWVVAYLELASTPFSSVRWLCCWRLEKSFVDVVILLYFIVDVLSRCRDVVVVLKECEAMPAAGCVRLYLLFVVLY